MTYKPGTVLIYRRRDSSKELYNEGYSCIIVKIQKVFMYASHHYIVINTRTGVTNEIWSVRNNNEFWELIILDKLSILEHNYLWIGVL